MTMMLWIVSQNKSRTIVSGAADEAEPVTTHLIKDLSGQDWRVRLGVPCGLGKMRAVAKNVFPSGTRAMRPFFRDRTLIVLKRMLPRS